MHTARLLVQFPTDLCCKSMKTSMYIHILITCYLCKRSQYACVNGSPSGVLPVTSRVTQGSISGPLLFIFYINDIRMVSLSDGTMSLRADDLMLCCPYLLNNSCYKWTLTTSRSWNDVLFRSQRFHYFPKFLLIGVG